MEFIFWVFWHSTPPALQMLLMLECFHYEIYSKEYQFCWNWIIKCILNWTCVICFNWACTTCWGVYLNKQISNMECVTQTALWSLSYMMFLSQIYLYILFPISFRLNIFLIFNIFKIYIFYMYKYILKCKADMCHHIGDGK